MRTIHLHKKFEKRYTKLPPNIKEQFKIRRDLFLKDPFHPLLNNHSVEKVFPGSRSINITGDYRAVFTQTDDLVMFTTIGTHSELYG